MVTTGKISGRLELAAQILPNIAKPLENSAILPGRLLPTTLFMGLLMLIPKYITVPL